MKIKPLILIVLCILLLLTGCTAPTTPTPAKESKRSKVFKPATENIRPGGSVAAKVVRVTDGDTFVADIDGVHEKIRLIGVNTPETRHPSKGVEHYGKEASAYAKKSLTGNVRLEFDVDPRDRYDRVLAYVYLADGTFFNELLVSEGYAQVMTVPPNIKNAELFVNRQREAREAGKGLWGRELANH